jgi:Clp protease
MPRLVSKKPVKQPPLLYEKSQELIARIQSIIDTKLLIYWTSNRGNVCDNDVIALYELFKKVGSGKEIAIFIKSSGGEVEPSLRMVNLIREYYKRVVALVPMECASAATMIAVGADTIKMGPLAHLTAIDSSLTHAMSPVEPLENRKVSVSQDELSRIVKLWNENRKPSDGNPYSDIFKYIHPLVVGAIDRSSSLSTKICKEILSYHIKDEAEAERISRHLNSDYPSHSYPITIREARRIGLDVSKLEKNVNDLLLDLNRIYSEMAQKALTDFDALNYHDNEILNILEAKDIQIYYQNDKDWNYIKEERRWQALNDESSWRRIETINGRQKRSQFHVR